MRAGGGLDVLQHSGRLFPPNAGGTKPHLGLRGKHPLKSQKQLWYEQGRRSPHAVYAERIGAQVPGGGPQN